MCCPWAWIFCAITHSPIQSLRDTRTPSSGKWSINTHKLGNYWSFFLVRWADQERECGCQVHPRQPQYCATHCLQPLFGTHLIDSRLHEITMCGVQDFIAKVHAREDVWCNFPSFSHFPPLSLVFPLSLLTLPFSFSRHAGHIPRSLHTQRQELQVVSFFLFSSCILLFVATALYSHFQFF